MTGKETLNKSRHISIRDSNSFQFLNNEISVSLKIKVLFFCWLVPSSGTMKTVSFPKGRVGIVTSNNRGTSWVMAWITPGVFSLKLIGCQANAKNKLTVEHDFHERTRSGHLPGVFIKQSKNTPLVVTFGAFGKLEPACQWWSEWPFLATIIS